MATKASTKPTFGYGFTEDGDDEPFLWGVAESFGLHGGVGRLEPTDIELLTALGVRSYRFSVDWDAVLPGGHGDVDEAAVAQYSEVVDLLVEANIEPVVAVTHARMPAPLQEQGGWAHPDAPRWFVDLAGLLGAALGDRVKYWITMNDPRRASAALGAEHDDQPGVMNLAATFNLLRAHGEAVTVLRAHSPRAKIGISLDLSPVPAVPGLEPDELRLGEDLHNSLWLQALSQHTLEARALVSHSTDSGPVIASVDLETILSPPIDFLGINYRNHAGIGRPSMDLSDVLRRIHTQTPFPAYVITENGATVTETEDDGWIDDLDRVAYLESHVAQIALLQLGDVPIVGYFAWSFLDRHGRTNRTEPSGLVRVDPDTAVRTPKASFHWYRNHIRAGLG